LRLRLRRGCASGVRALRRWRVLRPSRRRLSVVRLMALRRLRLLGRRARGMVRVVLLLLLLLLRWLLWGGRLWLLLRGRRRRGGRPATGRGRAGGIPCRRIRYGRPGWRCTSAPVGGLRMRRRLWL
jgi:hypothetical protein